MGKKAEKKLNKAVKQQQKWLKKQLRKTLDARLELLLATQHELQLPVEKKQRKQLLQQIDALLMQQPRQSSRFKHPTLFKPYKRNPCSKCPAFHNGLCTCAVKAYQSKGIRL